MSVKLEKIEENKVKLTVNVDQETFNNALDFAFKKVVKNVEVKGFRKGKVPKAIFLQKYGEAALFEEAIDHCLPTEYQKAVEEANIEVVAQPAIDIDWDNIGYDKGLVFFATVAVKPVVTLGEYKGIEVTELSTEVTEEDIKAEVNKLLERQAELVVKESKAELEDTVVIDYEGFKDGVAFEGGSANNYSLKLGSNSFIPGFEDQLVGISANEEREINVTFPEEYHSEELKGANAIFKVKCHEVKTRVLPELNDEFVKDLELENIETVEQLENDAKEKLVKQKETNAKNHLIDAVVEAASENAEMNIPEEMVTEEANRMLQDVEQRLSSQGITLDLYLQFTGGTRDGLLDQLKSDAVKQIRFRLTLEAIAEKEGITASEEDVNNKYEELANVYQVPVEQVRTFIPVKDLEKEIILPKTVDFLVDNATKKSME